MKLLPALLCSAVLAGSLFAADVAALLSSAQRDMMAGQTAAAKAKFQQVLAADPENPTAKGYLRSIAAQEAKAEASGQTLQARLEALRLAKVEFKEAPLTTVIAFLKQKADEGGVEVNFVSQVPPEKGAAPVSLSMGSVPFLEALRYVCELAGVRFEVERHAVVIKPAG